MNPRLAWIAALWLGSLGSLTTVQVNQNPLKRRPLHTETVTVRHPAASPSAGLAKLPLGTEEIENLDLYGNEVNDAVAEYKLDATGALYEEHSPQTQVPRLAAPQG